MTRDSAPERWIYREHTRVKHEILRKYVPAWLAILGKYHPRLCYFDGFAGRGEYVDPDGATWPGSPLIAMQVAEELIVQKKAGEVVPVFIERDDANFASLKKIVDAKRNLYSHVSEPILIHGDFATQIPNMLQEVGARLAPSFFFIDPFGFSIPFSIIEQILSIPRTEIFFTFMIRDLNRFLNVRDLWPTFDELFGTSSWRDLMRELDRQNALRELYTQQLRDQANAKYTWDFRVCADERIQTIYYLIHATKHFKGLKIMKDITYGQGAEGIFAYLGPQDRALRYQMRLFDNDIPSLKNYLLDRFAGRTLTYDQVLEESYMDTPFIDKHYREALKALEAADTILVERVDSKTQRGLGGRDRIGFPGKRDNSSRLHRSNPPDIRIVSQEYQLPDASKTSLVQRVGDGSIITRFDKTPPPAKPTDVVCPHFLELKWGTGCLFDCAWCYLKGTLRFAPRKTAPYVKPFPKIERHVRTFLEKVDWCNELLNTGELADSLMWEKDGNPFSRFIISLFREQDKHRVLLLTKSDNIEHLLDVDHCGSAIMSFSLNADAVAQRFEKRAPPVADRIEAASELKEAGYEVRIRIDPMVPVLDWEKHYASLIDDLFSKFVPERITLGSLRGLQSTINQATDKSWVSYLSENSGWGKKIDFNTRLQMYSTIIRHLKDRYDYINVGLCKETVSIWDKLGMDYRQIACNCIL